MPTPQGKPARASRAPRTPRDGAGPKRATVQEVAEAAGVSTATVSRVLNGNYPVAADTRRRVEQAVRTLGYVVNAQARALAGSRTRTVGIIVEDIIDPFFGFIARGVQRQAAEDGKLCLVCSTYGVAGGELDLIDSLREQRADAVIVVGGGVEDPAYRRKLADRAHALNQDGSWLVLCGRPPLAADVPAGVVDYDNTGGAHAITDYLLGQGHRRILYIGGLDQMSVHRARVAGFRRAYASRGLEVDERLIQPGPFSRRLGYERTAQLLRDGSAGQFTAVFGANDGVAVGAMQALREAGLRIPQDVSVVGYDDIPLAAEVTPALTTVHLPLEQMGREAVRLAVALRGESDGPTDTRHVGTHVVIRDSTAPAPAS
ncbi:LacI family DNA-binding transcriptional regulator [Catenulispora sp. NF23]|uniref:LacI family DNA-binding transcriptional regulator n=1 Tax=Catenulispora pinistramenti TaxID=2705254 RepID=UPI001BA6D610|nr:LacI family DNA-binding transcriptional regulator [Catenulispora pinistramenti]MBS2536091.1 LacI family DNA-binding transcriptional regulator [Catenulispora pinistramenti]